MFAIERPMSRSLYAEAWLIVWSSCWLAVVFLGMIVVFVFGWPWLIVLALPIFVLSHAAAIAFAFHFRCPACQQRLLVQGFRSLHPARKRLLLRFASWIAVAFDIARHREFTCMHCGEKCHVMV